MRRTWRDAVLLVFAVQYAVTGGWALVTPRRFYDDFPGGGYVWVAVDGPYNEHLVRDVGALLVAASVIALYALLGRNPAAARTTGLFVAVFSLPHMIYHWATAGLLPGGQGFANVSSLAVVLGFAVAIVVSPQPTAAAARTEPTP